MKHIIKILFKKNLLLFIILIFFQSNTNSKANDLKDFELEGISVGDSLLDYFKKEEIKKNFVYKSDEFYLFTSAKYNQTYDGLQFHLKKDDENFIIESLTGIKLFLEDFENCFELKKIVVNELTIVFANAERQNDQGNHSYDMTGDSKYYRTSFIINPTSIYPEVSVTCYNWSEELEKQFGDKLTVSISTDLLNEFIDKKAY